MSDYTYPRAVAPRACEVILEAGLNPVGVAVDDMDEAGYFRFVLDAEGKHERRDGERVRERVTWPSLRVGRLVLEALAIDAVEGYRPQLTPYLKEQA